MQYFKHLRSDSGADRTYHTRDMVGRARASIRIEINIWANPIFHIHFRLLDRRDAVSRVEMDYRLREWSKEVSKEKYLFYIALEAVLLPYTYALIGP